MSRDYKVSGAIGPCTSLKRAGPSVSETEIGESGTTAWSLGSVNPSTSIAFYFDIGTKVFTHRQHSLTQFLIITATGVGRLPRQATLFADTNAVSTRQWKEKAQG